MTGRQEKSRKHLLDELRRIRSYSAMKDELLHHTLWRTGFRRGHGPVVSQTLE